MRVKVERVAEKEAKNGAKYLQVELTGGQQVYVWSSTLFGLFRPGRVLDVELRDGQGFRRVVRARAVPERSEGRSEGVSEAEGPVYQTNVRGDKALRTAALLAAARVLAGQKADAEKVLRWSEAFYDWLTSA